MRVEKGDWGVSWGDDWIDCSVDWIDYPVRLKVNGSRISTRVVGIWYEIHISFLFEFEFVFSKSEMQM